MTNTKKINLPKLSLRWVLLGILVWILLVLSQFPAVWAAYFISKAAPINFTQVSGTLWSGRASLASLKWKQNDYSLGQLTWKLDLWSMVKLQPCAHITSQMDKQELDSVVCVGKKGLVQLKNTTASFPSSLLASSVPVAIDGHFTVRVDAMELQGNVLGNLHAKIGWENAKINNGAAWMSLGTVDIDAVDDKANGISAHITSVEPNPIRMDLVAALRAPSGGNISGNLRLTQNFIRESQADAWISMFGSQSAPDAEGNVNYNINFKL